MKSERWKLKMNIAGRRPTAKSEIEFYRTDKIGGNLKSSAVKSLGLRSQRTKNRCSLFNLTGFHNQGKGKTACWL